MNPTHEHINPRIMKNYSRFVTTLAIILTLSIGLKAQCSLQCNQQVMIEMGQTGETILNIGDLIQIDETACPNQDLSITINGIGLTTSVTVNSQIPANLAEGFYAFDITVSGTGESCQGSFIISDSTPCIDTLFLDIGDAIGIDQIEVPVTALNAMQITSMQYTHVYDGTILVFNDVIPGALTNLSASANFFEINPGRLNFSWFDTGGGTNPATFNNNTVLYTLVFDLVANGSSTITIDPNEPSIMQEVINQNFEEVCLNYGEGNITGNGGFINGSILRNDLLDCSGNNTVPMHDWIVELSNTTNQYIVNTKSDGSYSRVVAPGDYTVTAYPSNHLWNICNNDINASVPTVGSEATIDFSASATISCPLLTIGVSTPFVRRCFENTYTINLCNTGTVVEEDVYVEIELQDNLNFLSSSWSDFNINGQLITFNVGEMDLGCINIYFQAEASCESELGESHCVYAEVFPQTRCGEALQNYDGPIIEVSGYCDGDSARFVIENTGVQDMILTSDFIVVEDDVMTQEEPFILDALSSTEVALPANGSTYRVTALQDPAFPLWAESTFGLEGCGTDTNGTFSTGFINDFSSGDYFSYTDIDCQENIGSYDPNDKTVYPEGYGEENLVKNNQTLDYKIRFQNTGTDTAFLVVVVDTLSELLDITTLKRTAASHPYTLSVEDRALKFRFENILLPDSTTNEVASHGFISFKVDMIADLADDSLIENNADIYFDFNDPIRTNTETLKIGSDFIEDITLNTEDKNIELLDLNLSPNPTRADGIIAFKGLEDYTEISMGVFDVAGKEIIVGKLDDFKFDLSTTSIKSGAYYIRLMSSDATLLYGGKLIIQ